MASDYKPASVRSTTKQDLQALTDYGPGAYNSLAASVRANAPKEAELASQLYAQYEPQYFATGERLQDLATQAAIKRDMANFQGGGRDLALEAIQLDKMANPQFYANREIAGKGFADLIGGQDPNKLSGAEMANVERGVNRTNANAGVSNIGDATTTAANALQYDDRLQNKRSQFAQSLALFPGIQQGSQSGINAYQVAAGRGEAQGNVSRGQYSGPQQFDANSFYNTTQNSINATRQGNNNINANRRTGLDFFNQTAAFGSGPQGNSAACCFIFLESYNGKLPKYIRMCRDLFYHKHPMMGRGYKKMAKWLVPLMKRSKLVLFTVNLFMVKPISRHGQWLVGDKERLSYVDRCICKSWFKCWKLIGNNF